MAQRVERGTALQRASAGRRPVRLLVASAVLALVWLVVLPALEQLAWIRQRIEHLERRQVNPEALYYTDLEAMPRLEQQARAAVSRNPKAFWHWPQDLEAEARETPAEK
jgi:hypothetical protein